MRLVIDSSSPQVCVGLINSAGEWEFSESQPGSKYQQSKLLFQMIRDLLRKHEIETSRIESLAVGLGPGSYTGLRVGLTLAKVWAFSKGIPLYHFDSRQLLGDEANEPDLKKLSAEDFTLVEDLDQVEPIYENDHFKEKK